MGKKISVEEFQTRLPKHIILDISTYINTHSKARFVDVQFGEWWAVAKTIAAGHEHPKRGMIKRHNTNLKKYGTQNVGASLYAKKKAKATNLRKYGVEFFNQSYMGRALLRKTPNNGQFSATPLEEIKNRLPKHLSIVDASYSQVRKKALFVDSVYGLFSAFVFNILNGQNHPKRAIEKGKIKRKISIANSPRFQTMLRSPERIAKIRKTKLKRYGTFRSKEDIQKARLTNIARYGAAVPSQNHEIALKQAKSANNSQIKYHWETSEELVCVGSYEAKVVDYLNKNKASFLWQPKTFAMPDGKTYRPDLYLVEEKLWIEIKGWMRKDAQEKWDWFQKEYPNSELWDKQKLREMRIL